MNKVHRPWRPYVTEWQDIVSHKYAGSGTDEEPYVVDWMATDPESPFGWAHGYQWWVTILVASFTFVFTFSSSAYSGAIGSIRSEFPGYQEQTYIAGLSLYVAGFALGPLVWAPLSELYGRRIVFLLSYACFVAFNGGVIACQNIWSLAIVRFFAGAFGSSVLSNSSGTISDLFPAKRRGLGISLFASAPFMGPSIGPFIGGFLGEAGGWRWVAALIAMLSGLAWILGFFCMPETYSPVLLRKRAVKLFEATGKIYRSRYEAKEVISGRKIFRKSLIRPWKLLFSEPIVFLLSLYLAIVYGTLYLLFSAFPVVYSEQRGWSAGLTGLSFLGLMVGFLLALLFTVFIENPRYTRFLHKNGGSAPPEQRLIPACIGSVALPAGLFWFAWTAAPVEIHWIVSILAGVPFGFGMVLVFLSVLVCKLFFIFYIFF